MERTGQEASFLEMVINEKFDDYLQSLRPKPEVAELYLTIMESTFDRERQLAILNPALSLILQKTREL